MTQIMDACMCHQAKIHTTPTAYMPDLWQIWHVGSRHSVYLQLCNFLTKCALCIGELTKNTKDSNILLYMNLSIYSPTIIFAIM